MKAREREPSPPSVGQLAPDFVLDDLAGHPHTLQEWRGQRVLLVFWAPWSPLALQQVHALRRLSDGPYVVVDVALDALDAAQITEALGPNGMSGHVLHLIGHSTPLARWGGFSILPVTFVLDGAGVVQSVVNGYVDANTLQGLMGRSSGRSTRSSGIALRTFSPSDTTPAMSTR